MAFTLNFYLSNTTSEPLELVDNPSYNSPYFTIQPPPEIQAGTKGHWQTTYNGAGGGVEVYYQMGQFQFEIGIGVARDETGYHIEPFNAMDFPPGFSFNTDPDYPSPLSFGFTSNQQINLNLGVAPK